MSLQDCSIENLFMTCLYMKLFYNSIWHLLFTLLKNIQSLFSVIIWCLEFYKFLSFDQNILTLLSKFCNLKTNVHATLTKEVETLTNNVRAKNVRVHITTFPVYQKSCKILILHSVFKLLNNTSFSKKF